LTDIIILTAREIPDIMFERMEVWIELFREGPLARALIVLCAVAIGYIGGKMAGRAAQRALSKKLDAHQTMIARRLSFYLVMALCTLTGFNEAGINLSVLIGAAGVLSVAIGFASQTTMSNLISGLFMLIERPFMVGDIIRMGATTGEVTTVGLLSTILKTPDNQMVRIPNESLMKSEITNTTRYNLRKIEIPLCIATHTDLAAAQSVLLTAVKGVDGIKEKPEPQMIFKGFGDNGLLLVVDFWCERDAAARLTLAVATAIKDALSRAHIEMPAPLRQLVQGSGERLAVEIKGPV
jgi:small-conductance mechanosensitive channel